MSGTRGDGAQRGGSPKGGFLQAAAGFVLGTIAYAVLLALDLVLRIADRKPVPQARGDADEVAAR
jgi:hypothetical protein